MIDFTTIDRMNEDTLALASRVTTHMRSCEECMRKVRAFGVVYDELKRLGRMKDAKQALCGLASDIIPQDVHKSMHGGRSE